MLLQLADRQFVDDEGYVQTSAVPLHDPPHGAAPEPVHAVRDPCGCPLGTRTHVPTLPPTSHALHCEVQLVSQQTPSTQLPVAHWVPTVHTCPLP